MTTRIIVSPDMQTFVGRGSMPADGWLPNAVGFAFDLETATVSVHPDPACPVAFEGADVSLIIAADECRRVFGFAPQQAATWHLTTYLRAIALAIADCPLPAVACETLRLAKSIELFCALFAQLGEESLVPADGSGELTAGEAERIAAARRLIDERWHEKLTLALISRACGINRAKLTRGFRHMFDMTVADAITDRRLGGAREMLLATDLPVSSIAYSCGYLNNASFTRAFSRRFGLAPTQLRGTRLAA